MALVRFGGGVSEIRGSIAGNVFSRSHAGAIIRNRIVPVNPNTPAQDNVRALFAAVAQLYTDLDAAARQAWQDYADLLNETNVFGDTYTPTGRQVFQQVNMNTALVNSEVLASPGGGPEYTFAFTPLLGPAMDYYVKPAPPEFVGDDRSFVMTITAGSVSALDSAANLTPPNATDDIQRVIIEATDLMRPTIANRARKFRLLGSQAAAVAAPLDLLVPWNTVHGAGTYQAGQTMYLRLSTVNKGGLRSDPVTCYVLAEE